MRPGSGGGAMHFLAVLNRDGGTLRTTDLDAFGKRMTETLEAAGHTLEIRLVAGSEIESALAAAARSRKADVVMAGGGDGTASAAAAALAGKDKLLAILPAGTMNLFARSLGLPLQLDAAVAAFATGQEKAVDVASANGRIFVHQFSIGMHAKMVHLREKMDFGSRWGKIRASARAAFNTFMNPPDMKVELTIGDALVRTRTIGIGVTNNLFGEGHLPYADNPAGGILGIYVTTARRRGEVVRFLLNMARGRWNRNDQVEIHETHAAVLKVPHNRKFRCVIDGELNEFSRETKFEIKPGVLKVLVPSDAPA